MKKNKIVLIIISAFVMGVIVTLIGLLIFKMHDVSTDNDADDTDYMGVVVIDGFEISIPNQNKAFVNDEVGLSYSDKGTFEMSITVVDGSYELTLNDIDSLNSDIDSWFTLKKSFDEISVGGNSYVYCVYDDEGENILLAFKEADKEHSFQIMVRLLGIDRIRFQSEEELTREYESYILIADSLLDGARPTDKENTPSGTTFVADEMYSEINVVLSEEYVAEDSLFNKEEKKLVSYQIENDFYLISQEIKQNYYSQKTYCDMDRNITTTVVVDDYIRTNMDAEKLMANGTAIWTNSEADVKSTEIDGKTFYYYIYAEEYKVMGKQLEKYHFEAAADLENGAIYRVSASSEGNPDALEIDTYMKFMTVEEP